MRKKVLMICYYFPPCTFVGALRSKKFVQYLSDFGWASVVLSAYHGYKGELDNDQNVEVHSTFGYDLAQVLGLLMVVCYFCVNTIKRFFAIFKHNSQITPAKQSGSDSFKEIGGLGITDYINRWLLLPDSMFFWIVFALPRAFWLSRKCDAIYSSTSPYSAHVLGLILKKLTGKPWIADYRDEWSINSNWSPPTRFHRWLGKKLDKACVKNADRVIYVALAGSERFFSHFGGCRDKFVTIPNGYDEQDVREFRDVTVSRQQLTFTSIGSLYGGRDAGPFLKAVARVFDERKVDRRLLQIKLIGDVYPDLIMKVEKLNIADVVELIPRIPQQEAFMILGQSHVAVLIGSAMEKVAMTTKIYEYAGMGKPILALVPEGSVRDFVNKCGGWCIDCGDVDEISKVVTNIFEQHKTGCLNVEYRKNFVKNYERRKLTEQLAACFDSLIECALKKN